MDEDYKAFRSYLRGMNRNSLAEFCRLAGLNEKEASVIVSFYYDRRSGDSIADDMGMCRSALYRIKGNAIRRMVHFCHTKYRPENTDYDERIKRLDELFFHP